MIKDILCAMTKILSLLSKLVYFAQLYGLLFEEHSIK